MKRWIGSKFSCQGLAQTKDTWNEELLTIHNGSEKEINKILLNVIET